MAGNNVCSPIGEKGKVDRLSWLPYVWDALPHPLVSLGGGRGPKFAGQSVSRVNLSSRSNYMTNKHV